MTEYAISKVDSVIADLPAIEWYLNRCRLIKQYFGNLLGSNLKVSQYKIEEYKNTSFKKFIGEISEAVKDNYYHIYNERL